MHGWPTSSYLWRKVIPSLAKTRWVIAPDLPGFGQSDKPLGVSYTLNYHVGWLDAFLLALGIQKVALVVHDLGGPIGLLWAVRNPEKVGKLAILNTVAFPDVSPLTKIFLVVGRIPGLRDWFVSPSGIERVMKWGVKNKGAITGEVATEYQAPFKTREARKVLIKTFLEPRLNEFQEIAKRLSSLNVPMKIIYGANDRLTGSDTRKLVERLPNAISIAIPNCGHFLQEDQPEKLSELLIEFFSERVL